MSSAPTAARPEITFKDEFFDDIFDLEAGNFWFRCRNRLITWALNKYFPSERTFLEIGCGTGYVLSGIEQECPHLQVSGSELFATGLECTRKRVPNAELMELDAREMPFLEQYDVIGAFDVIEHIEEDQLVLNQMWKGCKRGIVLTVPQHQFLWSAVDDYACHKRRYESRELAEKVEKAGFRIVRMTSFVSLLLPAMVLRRSSKKTQEQIGDPKDELRIPPRLDRILETVLNCEQSLIRSGLNLPVGGSLLCVAEKR